MKKNILIGITSSIAAYKIYELIFKKILSLFVGLARYIRDKIVEFLLKLGFNKKDKVKVSIDKM